MVETIEIGSFAVRLFVRCPQAFPFNFNDVFDLFVSPQVFSLPLYFSLGCLRSFLGWRLIFLVAERNLFRILFEIVLSVAIKEGSAVLVFLFLDAMLIELSVPLHYRVGLIVFVPLLVPPDHTVIVCGV